MDTLQEKKTKLYGFLRCLGKLAVAFSAGVDSSLLLACAADALGTENVLALTATGPLLAEQEQSDARDLCKLIGVRHIPVPVSPLQLDAFREGRPDRCYDCKRNIFSRFLAVAAEQGFIALAEGGNVDDLGDYRPGMRAIAELGIHSPLREAGLTKAEIRALSRDMGLKTADKPSMACLASRFAYGLPVTEEGLRRVADGEALLRRLGFTQLRLRDHGELARIELPPEEIPRAAAMASELNTELQKLGYKFVSLDLGGYRTGSMNRTIGERKS